MDWTSTLRVWYRSWTERSNSEIVMWSHTTRSNRLCEWAYPPRNCEFSCIDLESVCSLTNRGCHSIGLSIVLWKHIRPCILHVLGGHVRRGSCGRVDSGMSQIMDADAPILEGHALNIHISECLLLLQLHEYLIHNIHLVNPWELLVSVVPVA